MSRHRLLELFIGQMILYGALWIYQDYLATLLSTILCTIFFFILMVSLIVEWIEPSKVPRWYFQFMVISILAPLLAGVLFVALLGGQLDWTL